MSTVGEAPPVKPPSAWIITGRAFGGRTAGAPVFGSRIAALVTCVDGIASSIAQRFKKRSILRMLGTNFSFETKASEHEH
jgi:hypothetical protein